MDGNIYECRVGGSCPICNAVEPTCEHCGELEDECTCEQYCEECDAVIRVCDDNIYEWKEEARGRTITYQVCKSCNLVNM